MSKGVWYVYILKCADGTYYTGITTDIDARINAHESGKGAKYTKGRTPLKLVYCETSEGRSQASKRENEIKTLSRKEKISLIYKKSC